jgi:hypothetical protein
VEIEVTNKTTGEKEIFTAKRGSLFAIENSNLKVHASHFIPNFTMGDGIMTSIDAKPDNPAVNLVISRGESEVWQGVAFMQYPEAHAFQDETYTIIMKNYIPSEAKSEEKK